MLAGCVSEGVVCVGVESCGGGGVKGFPTLGGWGGQPHSAADGGVWISAFPCTSLPHTGSSGE